MPRKPRMHLPGVPSHVIQRGNNRDATFFVEQDYQFYLQCLYDASLKYHVDIHAYVLMTNHVHLLMTPLAKSSISLLMQSKDCQDLQGQPVSTRHNHISI